MNVYDFDGTIYNGDSTKDFYIYCLKIKPVIIKYIFIQGYACLLYLLKVYSKTKFKEKFYIFLREIENIDFVLEKFWMINKKKIKKWYLDDKKENDIIISASPEFLLRPICTQLNIKYLIASRVDKFTGVYDGQNCYGAEKVRRFEEVFNLKDINYFYTDSESDRPIAQYARCSFIVKGNKISKW